MSHFRAHRHRPLLGSEPVLLNFKTPSVNFQEPGVKERLGCAVVMGLCLTAVALLLIRNSIERVFCSGGELSSRLI